jgi:hypothetical protein
MDWLFNVTLRPLYPQEDPITIVYEAGWAPGPVWAGAENLALTRIRLPDRPARSESLYQLSYSTLYPLQLEPKIIQATIICPTFQICVDGTCTSRTKTGAF